MGGWGPILAMEGSAAFCAVEAHSKSVDGVVGAFACAVPAPGTAKSPVPGCIPSPWSDRDSAGAGAPDRSVTREVDEDAAIAEICCCSAAMCCCLLLLQLLESLVIPTFQYLKPSLKLVHEPVEERVHPLQWITWPLVWSVSAR